MAKDKKGFLQYADYIDTFESLSDEQAGQLTKHIYRYINDLDPELDDPLLKMAFLPIKKQLQRDLAKWDKIKEAKSKGGKASAAKRAKDKLSKVKSLEESSTDSTVSVSVNVNDSVIVNDNVINKIEGFSEIFKDKWKEWLQFKKATFNFSYKTSQSEEAAIRKLSSLGGRDEKQMIKIIDESLAHGWKGFHEIKQKATGGLKEFLNG